ncbi:MAG: SRPBCC family protein [Bacteroidetes bacterium]|nr:SRPBCC family protein [Bacteroidota bacterium]
MKKILYVIIGLFVVYLILCLFGPSEVKIERSAVINAPADVLKTKMADLKFFHESWSPWTEKDPNMKTEYKGEMGQPGSSMSWVSEKKEVGSGTMTYVRTSGDTICQLLNFEGHGNADVCFVVTPDNGGSKVSWIMQNKVGFFARAFMLFMNIDKMVGPDFEKGLSKLKTAMEQMPAASTAGKYEVKELNWEEHTFFGKKGTYKFDQLARFFGETFPHLFSETGKGKIQPVMAPSAIYFSYDEQKGETECAAVACVPNGTELKGLEKFTVPASKVLQIAYYGAYNKSGDAHMAMDAYIKEKNLTQGWVIEEYVTDPMNEKDTAKWLTNIYYVIKN